MEENKVNSAEPMNAGTNYVGNTYGSTGNTYTGKTYASSVPAKVSIWSKVKQFLCQEITVELTPRQEKAFKEVYDFWHQDITAIGTKDFWLQDIEITL